MGLDWVFRTHSRTGLQPGPPGELEPPEHRPGELQACELHRGMCWWMGPGAQTHRLGAGEAEAGG